MRTLVVMGLSLTLAGAALGGCDDSSGGGGSLAPDADALLGETVSDVAEEATDPDAAEAGTPDSGPVPDAEEDPGPDTGPPLPPPPLPDLSEPVVSLEPLEGSDVLRIQPGVALGPEGEVLLAWTRGAETEGGGLGIAYALYGADGSVLRAPGPLETDPKGLRNEPDVCALAGGGWVVAWSVDTQEQGPDGENLQIRFRRVGADGEPVEAQDVRVYTERPGNHWLADVACLPGGGFVVAGVWPDDDSEAFSAFYQAYGADGQAAGDPVDVGADQDGPQAFPVVATGPSGEVAVAWEQVGELVSTVLAETHRPGKAPTEAAVVAGGGGWTASMATVAVARGGGGWLGAARVDNKRLAVTYGVTSGPATNKAPYPPIDSTLRVNPAATALGVGQGYAVVHLTGAGSQRTLDLVLADESGQVSAPVVVAQGTLPAYVPDVDWRAGRLAVAWTEPDETAQYVVRVAVYAPAPDAER